MYLSIDPGKTTGYALFDDNGVVNFMGKIEGEDKFLDQLESLVETHTIKTAIVEGFRNRPNNLVSMRSTNPTSMHIGAITRVLRKKKILIVMQEASPALAIGLRFLGVHEQYINKHVPDDVSALAHGTYYLRKQKIL